MQSVLSYWTQVVAGINHKLSIEIGNGAQVKMVMFIVWERAWIAGADSKKLTEFYLLDETTSKISFIWLSL